MCEHDVQVGKNVEISTPLNENVFLKKHRNYVASLFNVKPCSQSVE